MKKALTSHELATKEEVYSYNAVWNWIWYPRHATYNKRETCILREIVTTGKSYIHDGKASVSCNSQHVQTKLHTARCDILLIDVILGVANPVVW